MTTFVQEVCKIEILFLVSTIVYLSWYTFCEQ